MADESDVAPEILAELRSVCLDLPEVYEEQAWVGTRWRVRKRTFAHVLVIASGWPPAYARAAATNGPVTVLTFRSSGADLEALRGGGHPFFAPRWRADEVGMALDADVDVDWEEITELLTESYCLLAPTALRGLARPAD